MSTTVIAASAMTPAVDKTATPASASAKGSPVKARSSGDAVDIKKGTMLDASSDSDKAHQTTNAKPETPRGSADAGAAESGTKAVSDHDAAGTKAGGMLAVAGDMPESARGAAKATLAI